jgi:uncharacterized protein (TIGR02145 family)
MKGKFSPLLLLTCLLILSCKKESTPGVLPTVETYDVSDVGQSSAVSGGRVITEGSDKVNTRGICWSKNNPPKISEFKKYNLELDDSSFDCIMDHLSLATTYYVKAFAINSTGFGYGEVKSFKTPGGVPSAETLTASNIGRNSAKLNGIAVANYYSSKVSFEWGLTTSYGNIKGASAYSYNFQPANTDAYIFGLAQGSLYHYRIKAENDVGTTYGNDMTFTTNNGPASVIFNPELTYGSVTDIDGNIYKTIQIDNQTWMAENLRTTKFNNGSNITFTDVEEFNYDYAPRYGWYNNDLSFKDVYGALYNWYTVDPAIRETKNICPAGWHVPDDTEWNHLASSLGGAKTAAIKLKEISTTHWEIHETNTTNESGFTALPGGMYNSSNDEFFNYRLMGFWWCTTIDKGLSLPYYYSLSNDSPEINKTLENKASGLSVRCVKDN